MNYSKTIVLFVVFFTACFSCFSVGKKEFEKLSSAEIQYEITYKGIPVEEQTNLPSKTSLLVSNSSIKKILQTKGVVTQIIANADSGILVNTVQDGINKIATVCTLEDIKDAQNKLIVKIKKQDNAKVILGFPCDYYKIEMMDNETSVVMKEELYATTYIGNENQNFYLYPEVKGCILYSKKNNEGDITILSPKKIIKKRVNIDCFSILGNYTIEACR